MCGITGWLDWTQDLRCRRGAIEAMTATLRPRGPDASDVWISAEAALGHTRLSVIDLVGGQQPMVSGNLVLVFSGEIYNYRELRRELEGLGHTFRTVSDTEVLLRSYEQFGAACVERLNGMFAFAVWDQDNRSLFLARDRLGVKPLYHARLGSRFLFGSEPKAILANPHFTAGLDAEGVAELFAVPGARTPGHGVYRDLAELRPGHVLTVSRDQFALRRYWQLPSRRHEDDPSDAAAHVRDLLDDIVDRQLVSDVPVSVLLSGGVDSSTIAGLAARTRSRRGQAVLPSFSMDYEEQDFVPDRWRPSRDGPYAELVADRFGLPHTNLVLSPEHIDAAAEFSLSSRDLPGWGDLDASLGLLFAEVRARSTVALSGESADEIFGGYPWYSDPVALGRDFFPWLDPAALPSQLLRQEVRDWARPDEYAADRHAQARAEVPVIEGESPRQRRIREACYLGLTRWLPLLLDRKDRLSMRVGLEVRVPYCDHRLVGYVWDLPWGAKTIGGMEKGLLRRAMADVLPEEILLRRKCAPPACRAPAYEALLRKQVDELLQDMTAPLFELVDRDGLRAAVNGTGRIPGPTPGPNTNFALGYLLDVNGWLQRYKVSVG